MWTIRRANGQWEVGYYMPDGNWFTDSAFEREEQAIARAQWLAGGD